MPDILQKLSPDRDLQCYFEHPSAIAALSNSSENGFTISGTWRQQFDWAVIEWNRDNVFEHPAFRYLPDGDLSGLTLSYDETRLNCIPLDSDLYATVDWPSLRIWCDGENGEEFYQVPLKPYAEPVQGTYQCASATFDLQGTAQAGDYIGIAWMSEHHTYQVYAVDSIDTIVKAIVLSVNTFSPVMKAEQIGTSVRLYYVGADATIETSKTGANGNRLGAYSYTSPGAAASWQQASQQFRGGQSPTTWRVTLRLGNLKYDGIHAVPMTAVRKMRWTYAADFQMSAYQRSEFFVQVTNWTVTGDGRTYRVAGPGSRRIEDSSSYVTYTGAWTPGSGNYSGGTIHGTNDNGATATCTYSSPQPHELFLGSRVTGTGSTIQISVDGALVKSVDLKRGGEDYLCRIPLGLTAPGTHSVTLVNSGSPDEQGYFDFLEIAIPDSRLPVPLAVGRTTLATDWDTDHSLALPAERTAWLIRSLGFNGRVNHYVGAMWFYELARSGHNYASAVLTFEGDPAPNAVTEIDIWRKDHTPIAKTAIQHLNLIGDTAESIAKAFEMVINNGYTAIRAEAVGRTLTIHSRSMGSDGNQLAVSASPGEGDFRIVLPDDEFRDGVDGDWLTDLTAIPVLNRAARDWSESFFRACAGYGLDVTAAFSTELRHGDLSLSAGIAQRYPSGNAVVVSTPATQTNFSPASEAFWREVYLGMAQVMRQAGVQPYLQFGEVQYWYFADDKLGLPLGLPFYDEYTKTRFKSEYGRDLALIDSGSVLPSDHPEEAEFLPKLIGEFTAAIMRYVRGSVPDCRFEVLYPVDTNDTPFNRAVNFPTAFWTPDALDNLKTESFTYTYSRNLDLCRDSINYPNGFGFPISKRSHLIGIGDPVSPWLKEVELAQKAGVESIVLFALDQFCLMGYPVSLRPRMRRSIKQG